MKDTIRILATSDVHGYICPITYAENCSADLGLARLSTLIDTLRTENTVLIDNGDMLEGSPLSFYHYHQRSLKEVSPMSKVMNAMHYDFYNLGNHDFNYGQDALNTHMNALHASCLTVNVQRNGTPIGTPVIKECAGKKIAFFGVDTQYIPNWELPEHIAGLEFLDCYETAKATAKILKEEADFVVCCYHGGFECDLESGVATEDLTGENEGYAMLKDIDEIDVLIAGHQHRSMAERAFGKVCTETADKGAELACVDIDLNTRVCTARLYKADTPADEKILALIQEEEDACQKWLDTPLGTSAVDLKVTDEFDARLHKSQLITFLNLVEQEATGADLAANALFLGASGFGKNITMRNIVSTYVYPNTLVIKQIDGKCLKEYLEKIAEYWSIRDGKIVVSEHMCKPKPQHYNYDMVDGIDYTIDVKQPVGSRITSLKFKGQDVTQDMQFTLAVNNYRAGGGGNYNMLKDAKNVKEIQAGMVELLAEWILKHKVVDFEPVHNIQVMD